MKAIEFPEVNLRIAENQPEYETLPANIQPDKQTKGFFNQFTFCFELDEDEKKQIAETGHVWQTVLVPKGRSINPIFMSTLKPEMNDYCKCTPDETTGWTEFEGKMMCNICGKQVDPKRIKEILIATK